MKVILSFSVLLLISLSSHADVVEQVTVKAFQKGQNQIFATAPLNLPFSDGEILNVETDCVLTVQKVSPGAILLKTDLCQNLSKIEVNGKMFLVRKEYISNEKTSNVNSNQIASKNSDSINSKNFYFGIMKTFEDVRETTDYDSITANADQELGFSAQFQQIRPQQLGFIGGMSYNKYRGDSSVTKLVGAGTIGLNENLFLQAGLTLNHLKGQGSASGSGTGYQFGLGARVSSFAANVGYAYSKNQYGSGYTQSAVEFSGMEVSAGVIF